MGRIDGQGVFFFAPLPPCACALRPIAQLGYQAGVPLTQISRLLGHASLTTTQRYLNLDL